MLKMKFLDGTEWKYDPMRVKMWTEDGSRQLRVVHPGTLRRRAEEQFFALTRNRTVDLQHDLIRFGLLHPFYFRTLQFAVQLPGNCACKKSGSTAAGFPLTSSSDR